LNRFPSLRVEVGGHTDSDGRQSSNQRLSQSRADAVRRYLISKNVRAANLTAKGYQRQPLPNGGGFFICAIRNMAIHHAKKRFGQHFLNDANIIDLLE